LDLSLFKDRTWTRLRNLAEKFYSCPKYIHNAECIISRGNPLVLMIFFSLGNRLVTVPPQALGISPTGVEPAAASPAATVPPSLPTPAVVATPPTDVLPPPPTPPPAISSRTMEQLAEFDSILESKFQYNNTGSNNSLLLQGTSNSNSITMIKSEAVEPTAAAGDAVIGPVPETPVLR
jgi:hypothetical protein